MAQKLIDDLVYMYNYNPISPELPKGIWIDEPDLVFFTIRGFPCIIKRHFSYYTLLGYVGMVEAYPGDPSAELDVHGGITYAGELPYDLEENPLNLGSHLSHCWWVGFDCMHGWDFIPGMVAIMKTAGMELDTPHMHNVELTQAYRTVDYVVEQLTKLVEQIEKGFINYYDGSNV